MAIPGTIIRLRHYGILFTLVTLVVSVYETVRYGCSFGPLPKNDSFVLTWVLLCLLTSIIGTLGTFTLHKGLILAASILFCCAVAPSTPNMIVLTQGDEYQYFIGLTIFMLIAGAVEIALYGNLVEEMNVREALKLRPLVPEPPRSDMERIKNLNLNSRMRYQPCGCHVEH